VAAGDKTVLAALSGPPEEGGSATTTKGPALKRLKIFFFSSRPCMSYIFPVHNKTLSPVVIMIK
jgi:hypothetical protein